MLSEQGRFHIVGNMPELEDQLCEWVPGEESPDRMDACVWAVYGLTIKADYEEHATERMSAVEAFGGIESWEQ